MAFKLKSPFNAYMDDADASKLRQAQHSSSYTGPKNMITADGVNTQLTQDDKITTVGGDDPFSGYSKDSFKKKNGDDTPVPTDAEMKNTFDQFLFDNKEELDKLDQDAKDAQKRKQPLYPSQQVQKRTTTSMRNPKDQLVDVDKYRKQKEEQEKALKSQDDLIAENFSPKSPFMKKKQLTKTGAGKAHNMSALHYNQEQLMSSLSGASDQPSKEDLDAMKALLSIQNSEGMSSSPMNQNGGPGDPPTKKPAYRLSQEISKGDTTSYELVPGKTTMEQFGTNADGSPRMIPSTTLSKRKISNEEYNRRMKGSPAKNDVRKMKKAAKKEDKAKIKAKRKEGTLDSSDFANQPYRTLKGKF